MAQDIEALFEKLRHSPFVESVNGVPQEVGSRSGNITAQGWLQDNSVSSDVIQAGAVITDKLSAGAVTADKIQANTITASQIAAGTITGNEIAANSITSSHIVANTIVASDIAANTITANEIAANTITANEILANTLTANEIAANAITATELAADSVITNKILAGNVTSAKIELTVSGKNFGANDGSAPAPGIFFDADNDTGIVRLSASVSFIHSGSDSFNYGATINRSFLNLDPNSDNTVGLGKSGSRWTDVWAVDGTINTSDERLKQDIADSPLGLDFIKNLRPRVYRWRDTVDTQAREAHQVDEEALAREEAPHLDNIKEIRSLELQGAISSEIASEAVDQERAALDEIRNRHIEPVRAALKARRPGRRYHYGLIAQEVKQALDAAGVDAAFWKRDQQGEQSLSYGELIAPLMKAVQELAVRVESLES